MDKQLNCIIFFNFLVLLLNQASCESRQHVQCYEWDTPATINASCGTGNMIRITDVQYGRTNNISSKFSFCANPFNDSKAHCFERYPIMESTLSRECNTHSTCVETVAFHSFEKKCNKEGYSGGAKYIFVIYDCLPVETNGEEILIYDMTQDSQKLNLKKWKTVKVVYLRSTSYPQSTSLPINICEIQLKENTKLQLKVLDFYAINFNKSCPYEYITNNKITENSQCADTNLDYIDYISVYESGNLQETIQVALKAKNTTRDTQAKLWLEVKTFTLNGKLIEGIVNLKCGLDLQLWEPSLMTSTLPIMKTNSKDVTTPRTSQLNLSSTPTSTITVMSTKLNTVTTTKMIELNPTPSLGQSTSSIPVIISTTTEPHLPDTDQTVGNLQNSSVVPIIAGVIAGGLVLVIIIIVIVLMVRRHYVSHKPAKDLDVIDAWDNQSVISAAKQSAKQYKEQELLDPYEMSYSLPITYPQNGGPSFVTQISTNGDIYAEVPALPGSKHSSDLGISNKGYERDSFYTGDVDGDICTKGQQKSASLRSKKSGHLPNKDPLIGSRVSQVYSQPKKLKKNHTGFDDPTWVSDDIFESQDDENEYKHNGDVYGYTTTLEY